MDPFTIGVGLAIAALLSSGAMTSSVNSSGNVPEGIPASEWNDDVKTTLGRVMLAESANNENDWKIVPHALRRQYTLRRAGDVRSGRTPRTFMRHMHMYNEGLKKGPANWNVRQRTIFTMPFERLPAKIQAAVLAFEQGTLEDIAPNALDWGAPGFRSAGRERTATNISTANWYYTGRRA